VKAISGIGPCDEGQAYFNGEEVELRRPQDAAELGIASSRATAMTTSRSGSRPAHLGTA
jgi:ABC-type branched-subunit amino acid transport system ATPase component